MSERRFEEIAAETARYIYTLAYRLTASSDDARDLAQETYTKALEGWGALRNRENPLPWLRRICLNIHLDAARGNRTRARGRMREVDFPAVEHRLAADQPAPDDYLIADEETREIRSQCFTIMTSSLATHQRIAFVLVDIFGLEIAEVSAILHKTPAAVKSLLARGRSKMYRFLGARCRLVSADHVCRCSSWKAFANDIERRRDHLRSLLRTAPGAPAGDQKNKLAVLYRTLPYLEPPAPSENPGSPKK